MYKYPFWSAAEIARVVWFYTNANSRIRRREEKKIGFFFLAKYIIMFVPVDDIINRLVHAFVVRLYIMILMRNNTP